MAPWEKKDSEEVLHCGQENPTWVGEQCLRARVTSSPTFTMWVPLLLGSKQSGRCARICLSVVEISAEATHVLTQQYSSLFIDVI